MRKIFKTIISTAAILTMAFSPFAQFAPEALADTNGISLTVNTSLPSFILNDGTGIQQFLWTITNNSTPSYYTFNITKNNETGEVVPGTTLTVDLAGQSSPIHNPEWPAQHLWNVPAGQTPGIYSANIRFYTIYGYDGGAFIKFDVQAPACSNECSTLGTTQCSGAGYQACGNYDSDSCLEWSGVTNCSTGYICSEGDCVSNTTPLPNPELGQSCGLDIALVIDSSGSINASELNQVKTAFRSFVDALLPTTPTQFSVIDFDKTARILTGFTSGTSTIISAINNSSSGGTTNWEDALIKAQSTLPNRANPNLVVIASDGNPNAIGSSGISATESNALQKAIIAANDIKNSGTRIIALGIGNDLDLENLKKISSDDAVYTTNFNTLASDLANLASQLCGGTITVTNYVDGTATAGWEFQIGTTTKTTGADGKTEAVQLTNGTYNVTETLQPGYVFSLASCSGATNNGIPALNGVSGIQVGTNNIISCIFNNSTAPQCLTNTDCDNGLYCDGQETCQAGKCVDGLPIACTGNNVFAIATCSNDPDGNLFTWDNLNAFTSVCSEETDSCTLSTETITHTCDTTLCGAQCDASHACADTVCHNQNGCVGKDYYTYSDVANTCLGDCTCTSNVCGEPIISYNDPACTECQTDADCVSLDKDYCEGSMIKHDAGICANYSCQASTTAVQDCDNGLYCDGQETCFVGSCVAGTPVNCSINNVLGIATCSNTPDDNPFTWDARNPFTSVCSEDTDSCSFATDTDLAITHNCSADCGGCVSDNDCNDDNPDTIDTCNLNSCQCEYNPSDCPSIIVVSNTEDDVTGLEYTGKAVLTWVHGIWASIPQANWIWKTYYVENSLADELYGFSKSFEIVGTVSSATLNLAADNTYRVWLNNVLVGENLGEHNYENSVSYNVADKLQNGANTIKFEVMNMGLAESTAESNPAGLLYKLQIIRSSCEPIGCTLGATSSCSTGLLGVCSGGISVCGDDGNFGTCMQSIASSTEVCSDGLDNDCDGLTDADDSDCWECQPQATSTCATELFGICGAGLQTCQTGGFWGDCVQSIASSTEVCADDLDNDCNGVVDNGCAVEYYCGDSTCNNGEDCNSCPSDCGTCGGGGGGGGGGVVILTNLSIFNEIVASVGINDAVITWQTNLFADSNIVYSPASSNSVFDWDNPTNYGYVTSGIKDTTQVTFHTMTLTGLTPATTYQLRAISFGGSEKAVSTNLTFTTQAVAGIATSIPPVVILPPIEKQISAIDTEDIPEEESIIMQEEKVAGLENIIKPEVAVAAVGFWSKNFCWLTLLLLIILTILHLTRVIEKSRRGKKEGLWLTAIIIILIVLYFWKCCCFSCQALGLFNCWKQWVLIIINLIILAISLRVKEKELTQQEQNNPSEQSKV